MLFKYRKIFGIIRILLGILFIIYPGYYYFSQETILSEQGMTIFFVFVFFLLYAYSAIRNGIQEINENLPAFNMLRFFEASMNGFIGLYFLILVFTLKIPMHVKVLFFLITIVIIIAMVRDIKLISIQYIERKRNQVNKK